MFHVVSHIPLSPVVLEHRKLKMDEEQINALVTNTIKRNQEQTLEAASTVAEKIASDFLKNRVEKALADQKQSANIHLKGKGNIHQYNFCRSIDESLDKASNSLAEKDIESAKGFLEEGKQLVKKRIKLIRLADWEDWETVNEYLSDDLASNSEDEKTINRAIRAANAKREKRRKIRTSRNTDQRSAYSPYSSNNVPKLNSRFEGSRMDYKSCWECGRTGHFMRRCPLSKNNISFSRQPHVNSDFKRSEK